MDKINRELLHFISASPSPYHAVEQIRLRLEGEGYTELLETEPWKLTLPGIVECPQCHEKKLAHRVCKNCGYYKGVQVIDMTEKQEKA